MSRLSIVIPIFNEQETVSELVRRLDDVIGSDQLSAHSFEIIFVDDGSTDSSTLNLKDCIKNGGPYRIIVLSRNFGHQNAVMAGIEASKGDAVVMMDGDLQDPPELIVDMILEWIDGSDIVHTVRRSRQGESFLKKFSASLFYKVLNFLSDTKIPLNSADFKLLDRQVVDELKKLPEQSLYLRGLVSWIGFRQSYVEYDRDPRYAGAGKYTLKKMLRLAGDAVFGFSDKPLYLIAKAGILGILFSALLFLYFCWGWIVDRDGMALGWMSIVAVILALGSFQILALGIIGLYVGKIYRQTIMRPRYVINHRQTFEIEN
jgi:glycosyltransferase involved in cell wall biosynthesis